MKEGRRTQLETRNACRETFSPNYSSSDKGDKKRRAYFGETVTQLSPVKGKGKVILML
jgi:hypothetical protein